MWCYDENGNELGVISVTTVPQVGEEHMWDENLYVFTGEWHENGCRTGLIFKKVN